MEIKPIITEEDYEAALAIVSPMFDHQPILGTPEYEYFDKMATLIEAYEAEHHPIDPPDPIEVIKFRKEQGI